MKMMRTLTAAAFSFVAALAMLAPSHAAAGTVTGKITSIRMDGTSTAPRALISVSGTATNYPTSCFFIQGNYMALDTSTTRGQAELTLLIAAQLAGKTVTLTGSLSSSSADSSCWH